jgi:protein phosphatase PTC1
MGSTACVVHLIWESPSKLMLYSANCGDTRASLIHSQGFNRLSKDHRADDKDEKKRIIKSGGMVVNGRVMGALMLTRAFGDFELSGFGVIESPYISKTEVDLNIKNQFLIIACDGIWDLNSEREIMEMIMFDNNSSSLVQNIVKNTLRKDAWDNLSVFAIKLT